VGVRIQFGFFLTAWMLLLAGAAAAAGGAGSAPWKLEPGVPRLALESISCESATSCLATGSGTVSGLASAERWDGGRWTRQRIPSPAGAGHVDLSGVSCVGLTCVAAGDWVGFVRGLLTDRTLAEVWDGARWSIQPTPSPHVTAQRGAVLSDVACASAAGCVAVGSYGPLESVGTVASGRQTPLVERWDGARWVVQPTAALPFDYGSGELSGISCPSPSACTAVGYTTLVGKTTPLPGSKIVAFAEQWNGKRWSVQTIPAPALSTSLGVAAISCSAPSACTVVGAGFADRWNGRRWESQQLAGFGPGATPILYAVSCPGRRDCTAVGESGSGVPGAPSRTIAERWDGTRWMVQRTPNPHSNEQPSFTDVSCTSATACTATGIYNGNAGYESFLAGTSANSRSSSPSTAR
jgi:hypothetical protein